MNETGKNGFILKKSYEISYALSRVAANLSARGFAEKLFGKATDLIESAAEENYPAMEKLLSVIETLVRFGMDTNSIAIRNAEVLLQEMENLKNEILKEKIEAPVGNYEKPKEVDLSDVFSDKSEAKSEPDIDLKETEIEIDQEDPPRMITRENEENDYIPEIRQSATIRQSAILERIRQSGNCRLSDIHAILPECSERTIRYDLESLVEQNLVQRVGIGGRGVYYKTK